MSKRDWAESAADAAATEAAGEAYAAGADPEAINRAASRAAAEAYERVMGADHERRAARVAEVIRQSALTLTYLMPNAAEELTRSAIELGEAWADMADGDVKIARFLDTL